MRLLPGAALSCAVLAPVLVVFGSSVAAAAQPPGYDPVSQTLSALASRGATDRWIMTATFLVLGAAYVLVALGLGRVPLLGRAVLATGGVSVVLAGLWPQPAGGSSAWHMGAAGVAWVAFTAWPLAACRRPADPGLLGRGTSLAVTGVLLALLGWFFLELRSGGPYLGLAERVLVVVQTLWPLTVLLILRARARDRVVRPAVPSADGALTG